MKIVKLIGIFSIVLIVIISILQLTKSSGHGGGIIPEDDPLFEEMKVNLTNDWGSVVKWDESFYNKSVNKLDQSKKELTENGYKSLRDHLNEIVCNKLDSIMMTEYKKENCNDNVITSSYKGLDYFLSKNNSFGLDGRVVRLKGCYLLYNNIRTFVNSSIGLSANFDIENGTWNDFDAYRAGKLNLRDHYKNDGYYEYLKNINWVESGLASIDSKLSAAYSSFKKSVVGSIENEYSSIPCTDENLEKLQNAQIKYTKEFEEDALFAFVRSYKIKVENSKEKQ